MAIGCSAFGCTNRQQSGSRLQFHKFPLSDPDLLNKWLKQVKRKTFKPTNNSFLCEEHFSEDCYVSGPELEGRRLKKGAVPTIFNIQIKPVYRTYGHKELEEQSQDEDTVIDPDNPSLNEAPADPASQNEPLVIGDQKGDDDDSTQNSANAPSPPSPSGSKDLSDQDDSGDDEESLASAMVQDTHSYAGTKRTIESVMMQNVKLRKKIKLLRRQVNRKDAKIKELKHRLKNGDYDDPEVFEFHVRAVYS